MVELVDTPDLGSGARACRFESCYPHDPPEAPSGGFFILRWPIHTAARSTAAYFIGPETVVDGRNPSLRSGFL